MAYSLALLLGILQIFVSSANAYDYCGNFYYCYDKGSSIAYCCGYSISGIPLCCYYTAVWGLWYFWVGLVVLVFFISACIAACRRHRIRQQQQRHITTRTVQVATVESSCAVNRNYVRGDDYPPNYQSVQKQGIPPQFEEYSNICDPGGQTGISAYPQQGYTYPQSNMPPPVNPSYPLTQ